MCSTVHAESSSEISVQTKVTRLCSHNICTLGLIGSKLHGGLRLKTSKGHLSAVHHQRVTN